MSDEGLDDEELPQGGAVGWHKTRAFGHVAFVSRQRGLLFIAVRLGNCPLGLGFRRFGPWALIDVVEDY